MTDKLNENIPTVVNGEEALQPVNEKDQEAVNGGIIIPRVPGRFERRKKPMERKLIPATDPSTVPPPSIPETVVTDTLKDSGEAVCFPPFSPRNR